MAAPQAFSFNTKSTKDAKAARPLAVFVSFVLKDSAYGARPLSD